MSAAEVVPFAVAVTELAADVTKAVFLPDAAKPSPTEYALRMLSIAVQHAPVSELRAYLDSVDATSADHITDIAEEAKLAVKKMGG